MAKKDTTAAVLGMLSTTGASTRPSSPPGVDAAVADGQQVAGAAAPPASANGAPPAPLPSGPPTRRAAGSPAARRRRASTPTTASTNGSVEAGTQAPRTLRLRASTAAAVREAWLAAKRDDVLLSHQDFASDLLDDALARNRGPRG